MSQLDGCPTGRLEGWLPAGHRAQPSPTVSARRPRRLPVGGPGGGAPLDGSPGRRSPPGGRARLCRRRSGRGSSSTGRRRPVGGAAGCRPPHPERAVLVWTRPRLLFWGVSGRRRAGNGTVHLGARAPENHRVRLVGGSRSIARPRTCVPGSHHAVSGCSRVTPLPSSPLQGGGTGAMRRHRLVAGVVGAAAGSWSTLSVGHTGVAAPDDHLPARPDRLVLRPAPMGAAPAAATASWAGSLGGAVAKILCARPVRQNSTSRPVHTRWPDATPARGRRETSLSWRWGS